MSAEKLSYFFKNRFLRQIARDHQRHVVDGIARVPITPYVFARQLFEDAFYADDGVTIGMSAECFFEETLAQNIVRVIIAHRYFAENDLALFFKLLVGKRCPQCHVLQ